MTMKGETTLVAAHEKRILLLSEFFPDNPERAVYGVFQRLRKNMEALHRVGRLDLVFFCAPQIHIPENQINVYREKMAAAWPLFGDLLFIATSTGADAEIRRHPLYSMLWQLRGVSSFVNARPVFRSGGQRQVNELRDILAKYQPDLIYIFRLGGAGALSRIHGPLPPVVLDADDIEHVKIERLLVDAKDMRSRIRLRFWSWIARQTERRACGLADVVFVCSEQDRIELRAVAPGANIRVIPNTVSLVEAMPPASAPSAMFVGVAQYPPNREAIEWLVREIWPLVRKSVPDAVLHIIGQGSELVATSDQANGVHVHGFAPELESHYRANSLSVCPLLRGSGTRIKIIEAAMYGRAVVSTTIGAEGLSFTDGQEILIGDTVAGFSEKCITLLRDPDRCFAMGQAARRKALELYHPERVTEMISSIVREQCYGRGR